MEDGDIDVLIVGCGPAGLTLATQLAAFSAIRTRIIDQKPGPLLVGQADGIACRTIEMFEAFGTSCRSNRTPRFLRSSLPVCSTNSARTD